MGPPEGDWIQIDICEKEHSELPLLCRFFWHKWSSAGSYSVMAVQKQTCTRCKSRRIMVHYRDFYEYHHQKEQRLIDKDWMYGRTILHEETTGKEVMIDFDKAAKAFNMWMKDYTDDPSQFEIELVSVKRFLAERADGKEPSYGENCAAILRHYMSKLG